MTAPSRSLRLTGATNFRDLGGYAGLDGRTVRWRRLFRSDHLAALTAQDQAVIADLGLARAFDFRGINEQAAAAYTLPGVARHALTIEPSVVQGLQSLIEAGRSLTASDAIAQMEQTYRGFARASQARFGELFQHLLADDSPAVFHCTAGKDRTGFAAALLLLALGVPRAVVYDDFLLTNALYRRAQTSAHTDLPADVLAVLSQVDSGFLAASLSVVDQEFGGIDPYLMRLGVGPGERLRLAELYLQP